MMALALASRAEPKRAPKPLPFPPREPIPFPQPKPQTLPPAAARAHVGDLFAQHSDRIRSYAYGKLWAYGVKGTLSDLADEVCSETFLRWLEMALEGNAELPAQDDDLGQLRFLLGIARQRCRVRMWQGWVDGARLSRKPLGPIWPDLDPPAPPVLLPTHALDGGDGASPKQLRVQAALAKLRPDHAALLVGAYMDGATGPELAQARGRRPVQIQNALRMARCEFMGVYGSPATGAAYQVRRVVKLPPRPTPGQAEADARAHAQRWVATVGLLRRCAAAQATPSVPAPAPVPATAAVTVAPAVVSRLTFTLYAIYVRLAIYLMAMAPDTGSYDRACLLAFLRQSAARKG